MSVQILTGDCRDMLRSLTAESVHCVVTSPPYWGLRDYGVAGQIGLETSFIAYIAELVSVFGDVRRVLRDDGTCWVNLGDAYAGSWGAQSRGSETPGSIDGGSMLSARQIAAHPKGEGGTGSLKRTPGLKPKDLLMLPARFAIAMQEAGWWLRKDIIWHKPNPMPESVTDRPTSAHEHVFLFAKSERYFYDAGAIREAESVPDWDNGSRVFGGVNKHGANVQHGERTTGRVATARKRGAPPRHAQYESSDQSGLDAVPRAMGRNARDVWTIATRPYPEAHFATFPPDLPERCIKAGCPAGGTVLDPFGGAGTTGLVADRLQRNAILIELNPAYASMARDRIHGDAPLLGAIA